MITKAQIYIFFFVITNDNKEIMDERQLFFRIGERIRELRIREGISQQELADRCNFEKSNMSRIEAGRTNPTLKSLYRISVALGIPLRELVDVDTQ